MKREFVSSIYIFSKKGVVLLFHQKLKKWIAPGGHLEPNEMPHEAAVREAKEETGLDVQLIDKSSLQLQYPNAVTIPSAYMTLLHPVDFHSAHEHINFIFLAQAKGGSLQKNSEARAIDWFLPQDVKKLPSKDIFTETVEVLDHLFSSNLFPVGSEFDTITKL